MPSPIETLLRVQDSPVPTQIVLGVCGSIAIAPIDCDVCLSNTGLKVVPPFTDFQTPPLAAPMYTVSRLSSFTALSADTRPLIAADPMFRAPNPEIESESNFTSWAERESGNDNVASRMSAPIVMTTDLLHTEWFLLSFCRKPLTRSGKVRKLTVHLLPASLQV